MKEADRLRRSLAKAEDAAFKNAAAYLRERERAERLASALPDSSAQRKRGRPRGSLVGLTSRRELAERYHAAAVAAGRPLTEQEFADREDVSVDTLKARLRRFRLSWPPIELDPD